MTTTCTHPLCDLIETVHRTRDRRAGDALIEVIRESVEIPSGIVVECQLPQAYVEMMDEIIDSERADRPEDEPDYGTDVWAHNWLRELYA